MSFAEGLLVIVEIIFTESSYSCPSVKCVLVSDSSGTATTTIIIKLHVFSV